jgi:hypothetical protein
MLIARVDFIVPLAVKTLSPDPTFRQFGIRDLLTLRIVVLVEPRMHFEPGLRRGAGDGLHDDFRRC